jgi:CheY-like chemotaxis protein
MNREPTRVLVVDDDPFIGEVMTAVLEGGGYAVITAENGRQALGAFNAEGAAIGLIISDMNMPEMGGMELIAKIRGTGSDVPVIILTGGNDTASLATGADDHLLKDEHIQDTIIPMVENVLAKHALKKKASEQ